MVNHLSRCLLGMAIFSALSWAVGWPVVGYPLFATGIAAIMLADFAGGKRMDGKRRKAMVASCVAVSIAGIVFAPQLSIVQVVPVAVVAVLLAGAIIVRKPGPSPGAEPEQVGREDPVANLFVSLPSAVTLVAVLALA